MEITIKIKNVYGKDVAYPVCEKAKLFAQLADNITLTSNSLKLIQQLGYSIKVAAQEFSI